MKLPEDRSEVVARTVVGDHELTLVKTTKNIEAFTFTNKHGETMRWDVTAAKRLVAQGCVLGQDQIDVRTMFDIAQRNEWTDEGVRAADPTEPGIAVPLVDEGAVFFLLIDGIHRCVRCLLNVAEDAPGPKTFSAWLLTTDAARECAMEVPERLQPTAAQVADLMKGGRP